MAALERRLREIEQQKAELERKMSRTRSWLSREQEDAAMLVRGPRLQPAALPKGARGRRAAEPVGAGVETRLSQEDPERIASVDLGPAGEELKQAVTPQLRIRPTESVQPFAPGMRGGPALPNRDTPLDPYGVIGEVQRERKRKGEGSPRAKAIFMTLMTLVLAYVLFRMMT